MGLVGQVGLIVCLGLLTPSCTSNGTLPPVAKAQAEEVTLDQLLAAPSKFDGALVRVIGMGSIAFESTALSRPQDGPNAIGVSPAEAERSRLLTQHAVWLDLRWPVSPGTRALNGKYVLVEGRFDPAMKGHGGMLQGALKEISRIEESSPDAEREMARRVSAAR